MAKSRNAKTFTITRDFQTKEPKSIIVNEKYEIKKDGIVYDIHYANKPLKEYPSWLDEPQIKKLIKTLWNN